MGSSVFFIGLAVARITALEIPVAGEGVLEFFDLLFGCLSRHYKYRLNKLYRFISSM